MPTSTITAILTVAGVLLLALIAAAFTGWLTERRQRIIKTRQESAGVLRNEAIVEADLPRFLASLRAQAKYTVRVMAVSGRLALPDDGELLGLLNRGVKLHVLLCNPAHENVLFEQAEWLKSEVSKSLQRLRALQLKTPMTDGLEVRIHSLPQLFVAMFIDDQTAAVSAYAPLSSSRSTYVLQAGERSLYGLYDAAFRFLWERSVTPPPSLTTSL